MHSSAYEHGRLFFELYWRPEFTEVVELGSQNVNGSLRDHCPVGARYVGMDMAPANGVDLIVTPGEPFPIADDSVDVAVTSSAFEHDVCFWDTFLDLMRVLKPGGLLYVNAPSNQAFHRYPVDCWRFYPDAGYALTVWASRRGVSVDLLESFVAKPHDGDWADYVAVFRKHSDQPFGRKGRVADHTTAMNIFDIAKPDPMKLDAERAETWDMLEAVSAQAEAEQTRIERDQARSHAAELQAQVVALDAARTLAERELGSIRSSAVWRLISPFLSLSRR
jgi:SAM-dependent methyltransferase